MSGVRERNSDAAQRSDARRQAKRRNPKPREFWLCNYGGSYDVRTTPQEKLNADEIIHVREVLE